MLSKKSFIGFKSKKELINKLSLTIGILGSCYITIIQTPLYSSKSNFIIKKIEETPIPNVNSFLPTNNKIEDIKILEKYLNSREVFNLIDKDFNLKKLYNSSALDFLQRLYSYNTIEDYLSLYQKHLNYVFDEVSGVIEIGFLHKDPKISKLIVEKLLKYAEEKLNFDNKSLTLKQLKFISIEKEKMRILLEDSTNKLQSYQKNKEIFNPLENTNAISSNLNKLNSTLITKKMELNTLLTYQTEKSLEVVSLKNQINELENSINNLEIMLVGSDSQLSTQVIDFDKLSDNIKLYKELYLKSMLNLQNLKNEILKQENVLQIISKPDLPEYHSKPKYLYDILSLWVVIFICQIIVLTILGILKDRRI